MYNTAKIHFQKILTLYRHFEIEIHNLPKISNKSSKNYIITFEDLPTKEIIKNALEIANSVMRALILFIISIFSYYKTLSIQKIQQIEMQKGTTN